MARSRDSSYNDLCKAVQKDYTDRVNDPALQIGKVKLVPCDSCKEINLWTYWQGRGVHNPKILLVGQDWGDPSANLNIGVVHNIDAMNKREDRGYFDGAQIGITDKNLASLFEHIGFRNILTQKKDELFFTNICLGYRTSGSSGGLTIGQIYRDMGYFRELVSILHPEVIICLGKLTFKGAVKAFDVTPRVKGYNTFIDGQTMGHRPTTISVGSKEIPVFAMAHCGVMGTLNRKSTSGLTGMDAQKADWEVVLDYLK